MKKYLTALVMASLAMLLILCIPVSIALADIFQWEYINPANPSFGKQPSATLCPDGLGAYAAPGASLSNRNLTTAYLIGADLSPELSIDFEGNVIYYRVTDLTGANLSGADARGAGFQFAILTGANLSHANLTNVNFWGFPYWAIPGADLTNANLSGADARGASFWAATLTGANFTDAYVQGADFGLSQITMAQLYSTASFKAHDLSGTRLSGDFTNMNLAGQNLTNATFHYATLTGANLSKANASNADFSTHSTGSSDLTGANLSQANLTNVNFSGYEDENGYNWGANLTDANLSDADARGANFYLATLDGANTRNLIQSDGHIAGLNLAAGEALVAYAGVPIPVQVSGAFSIAPDATFDLSDNDLIVRATPATKDALHGEVQAKIASAQNGLDANFITYWDGPGITSSFARTANVGSGFDLVGLGVIRNSDIDIITGLPGASYTSFSGQPVTPDDVLVKYTYIGDGNLDGLVSFDDYVGMDNAFFGLIANLGWATGDINFDNAINFDDYTVVDQAFFFQGAPLSNDAGFTTVPEPATVLFLPLSLLATIAIMRYSAAKRARSTKNAG